VAVAPHRLLTNCHVVAGASVLGIGQRGQWYPVTVVASDKAADRCTLDSGRLLLVQTAHLRPYASLRVGEKAYSIGAPFGLEQTLGEGLISGLRRRKGVDYVQTSAPISLGSSGGGLFDAHANLIGITTFLLGGGQQLNFAIAAASYRID
jgi:S1-C subfamily serine protease